MWLVVGLGGVWYGVAYLLTFVCLVLLVGFVWFMVACCVLVWWVWCLGFSVNSVVYVIFSYRFYIGLLGLHLGVLCFVVVCVWFCV